MKKTKTKKSHATVPLRGGGMFHFLPPYGTFLDSFFGEGFSTFLTSQLTILYEDFFAKNIRIKNQETVFKGGKHKPRISIYESGGSMQ